MTAFAFLLAVAWLCVDWVIATMVDCAHITGDLPGRHRTVAADPAWPEVTQPQRHLAAVKVHGDLVLARAQRSMLPPRPALVMGQPGRWAA